MFFAYLLPLFALIAYYDYKQRDIPDWLVSGTWFIYGIGLAIFPIADFGIYLFSFILPVLGLGVLWPMSLILKKAHKERKRLLNGIRLPRFELGEVFILPLMLPVMAQFGGWMLAWLFIAGILASLWWQLQGSIWQARHGIPFLTFAFIAMFLVIILVKGLVISKWL